MTTSRITIDATGLVAIDGKPLGRRITIVPVACAIMVDGRAIHGLDLSAIDPQIHAVQWLNGRGHIELVGDMDCPPANIEIDNLEFVADELALWYAAADAEDNPPPRPWQEQIANAQALIDWKAGQVRAAYASPGDGIDREYALAEAQAKSYLAALQHNIDPSKVPVPSCVATEMAVRGTTAEVAAGIIREKAAAERVAIESIRAARLTGKATLADMMAANPEQPTPDESAALREATYLVVASLDSLMP